MTFFTEVDVEQLRSIPHVMKVSGCPVADWMLKLKPTVQGRAPPARGGAHCAKADREAPKRGGGRGAAPDDAEVADEGEAARDHGRQGTERSATVAERPGARSHMSGFSLTLLC